MPDNISVNFPCYYPEGFSISDNRLENKLQRFISPAAYSVYRQYVKFWGSGFKKKPAYPSLSYLSDVTGLSEKTIRRANKELVEKNFIRMGKGYTYQRGKYTYSNKYYNIPIKLILRKYYKEEEEFQYEEEEESEPIYETDSNLEDLHRFTSLSENTKHFYYDFKKSYKTKFDAEYQLDNNDLKSLRKFSAELNENNVSDYLRYNEIFFKTTNKYIEGSNYDLYFFLTKKVLRILVKEYSESKIGGWEKSAKEIFEKHIKSNIDLNKSKDELLKLVEDEKFYPAACKERDSFVKKKLIQLIESQITNLRVDV
jgi:hypothetical protein